MDEMLPVVINYWMKATEHYFPLVLFNNPYKLDLSLEPKDYSVTIHMKATEQYFPVVLLLFCTMWFYYFKLCG